MFKYKFGSVFLFSIFFSAVSTLSALPSPKVTQKVNIQVVIDGESLINVPLFIRRGVKYLSLKNIARIYSARIHWLAASGKVNLELNNESVQFILNTRKVKINDQQLSLNKSVQEENGNVLVPFDFVLSPAFANISEYSTEWNEEKKILTTEKKINVFPPRLYSYSDRSKISIEMEEKLNCQIQKNSDKISIYFLKGRLGTKTTTYYYSDGVVKKISVTQLRRQAKMDIFLDRYAGKYFSKILNDPPKVVIDLTSLPRESGSVPVASAKLVSPATGWFLPQPDLSPPPTPPYLPPATAVAGITQKYRGVELSKITLQTIVIDPGHGGKDPGAIGINGTREKDINLMVAQELARLLKEEKGVNVILTRSNDTFIPLDERTALANKNKADLFVSIHCNASISAKNKGFEVYFLSDTASDQAAEAVANAENSVIALESSSKKKALQKLLGSLSIVRFMNDSSELCALVNQRVKEKTDLEMRGVKQANFFVLRGAAMPAVLVEVAFISNLQEEVKLKKKVFRNRMADAIYIGILDYAKRLNNRKI